MDPRDYPITVHQPTGLSGCGPGVANTCGVPYGTPYGPYGLSQSPTPAPVAAPSGGLLASLPSWWPYVGLGIGGVLAITGIILMATKK